MKKNILFFLLVIPLTAFGQSISTDSTTVSKRNYDTVKTKSLTPELTQPENSVIIKLEKTDAKDWTDYFSAILAPLVALLAIWIAYRQYRTQHYQVRLDLFERRIKIIEDVRIVLVEIDKNYTGDGDKINLELFRVAYRHSKYLFSEDIQNYLKTIDNKIGTLENIELKLKGQSLALEEESNLAKEKEQIIIWLRTQRIEHESKFAKFMTLNKI